MKDGAAQIRLFDEKRFDEIVDPRKMVGPVLPESEGRTVWVSASSVHSLLGTKLLPSVLSVTAGSVDVISSLGLGGLFTAHITGNLAVLGAHIFAGDQAQVAHVLSVPVFMMTLGLTRLLMGGLETIGLASLRPLLLLQFLLLAGFLVPCVAAGPRIDPNAANVVLASMLGVSAMAVQNALVQVSLKGAPATAVMTTNVTRFMMDVGAMLLERDPDDVARARSRVQHTWPTLVGFVVGCGLGSACEAAMGLWSMMLPAGLALLALCDGFFGEARWWTALMSRAGFLAAASAISMSDFRRQSSL